MSKNAGTTQTTSQTNYPEFQLPAIQNLLSEANRLYTAGGPKAYQDPRVVGFNPLETEGQQYITDVARTSLPAINDRAASYAGYNLHEGLDPASNPYFQSSLNAAIRPVQENLLNSVLPSIRTQSRLAGTYGGSRQGIAEGLATKAAIDQAGSITSQMSANEYNNAQQRGLQTLSFLPTLAQQMTQPGQILSSVGETQRNLSQAQLNDLISKFDYEQNLPYQNLANYANLVHSPFGSVGTSTVQGPQASGLNQAIGLGLSLPSIIGLIQGLFR